MYRFIETIRLEDGQSQNITYHQKRVNEAFQKCFNNARPIELERFLCLCPLPSVGVHKIKIIYSREVESVNISLYKTKTVENLRLVDGVDLSYAHKFEDRGDLEKLLDLRGDCDDIIITRNKNITDASFANLIFKKAGSWFTPTSYLLNGTARQRLLDEKKICEEKITIDDLHRYEKVKLINAMLLMDGPEIDVSQIVG
jgi:4-amino-4-deoxychorismate lyase